MLACIHQVIPHLFRTAPGRLVGFDQTVGDHQRIDLLSPDTVKVINKLRQPLCQPLITRLENRFGVQSQFRPEQVRTSYTHVIAIGRRQRRVMRGVLHGPGQRQFTEHQPIGRTTVGPPVFQDPEPIEVCFSEFLKRRVVDRLCHMLGYHSRITWISCQFFGADGLNHRQISRLTRVSGPGIYRIPPMCLRTG